MMLVALWRFSRGSYLLGRAVRDAKRERLPSALLAAQRALDALDLTIARGGALALPAIPSYLAAASLTESIASRLGTYDVAKNTAIKVLTTIDDHMDMSLRMDERVQEQRNWFYQRLVDLNKR